MYPSPYLPKFVPGKTAIFASFNRNLAISSLDFPVFCNYLKIIEASSYILFNLSKLEKSK